LDAGIRVQCSDSTGESTAPICIVASSRDFPARIFEEFPAGIFEEFQARIFVLQSLRLPVRLLTWRLPLLLHFSSAASWRLCARAAAFL
jgi:hypothetical protein